MTKASEQEYPAQAQYNQRVYEGVATVIGETAELGLGALYSAREYKKLLLSGFAAAEISMIRPSMTPCSSATLRKRSTRVRI